MKNIYWAIAGTIICLLYSCSGMLDSIEPYLKEGETIQVGKLDSLVAYSGYNRAKITGYMLYGVNQTKCAITWLDPNTLEKKQKEYPIVRQTAGETFEFELTDLPEGQYDFAVVTFDQGGNQSIPNDVSTYVYGDIYQSTLINRECRSIYGEEILDEEENPIWVTRINWNITRGEDVVGYDVIYEKEDDSIVTLFSPVADMSIVLRDFKPGGVLKYTTVYQPGINPIDKFYPSEVIETTLPPAKE